ncbi:MAG: bidirectional hydrogenase complex protein HoxE [Chloroflexi bacterium]|nr:bidirectional hydrogenase complex protein HoxE [Chloroflexota bacterium]
MSKYSVPLPSDDKRWRIVQGTMRRNGFRPDALIETLHTVQESFGFLDEEALLFVSDALNVAPSQVYGVATFYHFFQLKPAGDHVCSVCTGTACYIKGGRELLTHLREEYNVEPDETTPDGRLSMTTVRCIGACGLAPAVVIDGEVAGRLTTEMLSERLNAVLAEEEAAL